MKNFKTLLLLFTAATLSLTSCRKNGPTDEKETTKPDTQAQTEAKSKIGGKWKITKAVFIYPNNPNPVVYTEYDDTQYYDFKTDGTVAISYVEKKGTFTYKFSENAQTLSLSNPYPNDVYKVKLLTTTKLVLEKEHTIDPIMTEEITMEK